MHTNRDRRLIWHGAVLFLLAIFSGWLMALTAVRNPRMILATHINALLSGLFLMLVGALGPHVRLGPQAKRALFWSLVISQYVFFVTGMYSGMVGTSSMFAGPPDMKGTAAQELLALVGNVIGVVLTTIAAMILVWGLRGRAVLGETRVS